MAAATYAERLLAINLPPFGAAVVHRCGWAWAGEGLAPRCRPPCCRCRGAVWTKASEPLRAVLSLGVSFREVDKALRASQTHETTPGGIGAWGRCRWLRGPHYPLGRSRGTHPGSCPVLSSWGLPRLFMSATRTSSCGLGPSATPKHGGCRSPGWSWRRWRRTWPTSETSGEGTSRAHQHGIRRDLVRCSETYLRWSDGMSGVSALVIA